MKTPTHRLVLLTALAALFAACSSTPQKSDVQQQAATSSPESSSVTQQEFVDRMAAVYRRVGEDVKKEGFRLVFTDVGPDSMERGAPELFARLLARGSVGGVRFKGSSNAVEDDGGIRDKKTGERGVSFMLQGFLPAGEARWDAFGEWHAKKGEFRAVKYQLSKERGTWIAR